MSLDKVSTFDDEILFFFKALYLEDGTMLPDPSSTSRPPRPNSIEVKRNYPPGSSGAYPNNEESAYGTRHSRSPQDGMYRSVIRFFKEDKNVVKIIERKEHEGYPVMCFPCVLMIIIT